MGEVLRRQIDEFDGLHVGSSSEEGCSVPSSTVKVAEEHAEDFQDCGDTTRDMNRSRSFADFVKAKTPPISPRSRANGHTGGAADDPLVPSSTGGLTLGEPAMGLGPK